LAGYEALRKGGNASDAAAAIAFALAVTFHPAGGLGGDFFALLHEGRTGKVYCLNSSGWAPSGLTADLIASSGERSVPLFGPFAVVIPGFVGGVLAMQRKFGRLALKELLSPALGYARSGFPAGVGICRSVEGTFDSLPPSAKKIFAPSGRPPAPGEWIRQEKLANVIEDVIKDGSDGFYKGWPAERIAEKLTGLGVPASKGDFDFAPEWVKPLTLDYKGTTVHEIPPNSMGATSLLMLKFLADKELARSGPLSVERIETTMDAAELAYGRKDEMLGDPRFGRIDMNEFMQLGAAGHTSIQGRPHGGDTTAFAIADDQGNVIAAVQSLYHHFGSKVFVEDCGIMLSNRGAGFSMSGPNKVEPRKRPLHTLSSLILQKGEEDPIGVCASGGDYRPMQHALFVTNIIDYSMPLEQSIDHPRFLWSGGRSIIAEAGISTAGMAHYDVEPLSYPGRTGVAHGVQVLSRARKAVCDVRGDGIPTGF
jgi:gamma-glutamyltranspeptidase/glutathione hydrolase